MYKPYKKKSIQMMRPYIPGEDLSSVSISKEDAPKKGGMIAKGNDNGAKWYVSESFFMKNYEIADLGSGMEDCRKFVRHVEDCIGEGSQVICKNCGRSMAEIISD